MCNTNLSIGAIFICLIVWRSTLSFDLLLSVEGIVKVSRSFWFVMAYFSHNVCQISVEICRYCMIIMSLCQATHLFGRIWALRQCKID